MKIGIVGSADRAVAWENHIQPHPIAKEVIIARKLPDVGSVDACFLLDESDSRLESLLNAIKAGIHTFLISPIPTDRNAIEKIYHIAEEANVLLQFSHWPTLAPASQWIMKRISRPRFIQILRHISYTEFLESEYSIEHYWINELAYCLKQIDGSVHSIDLQPVRLQSNVIHALHIFLRFDNGTTANIFINSSAGKNDHKRFTANSHFIADCNVLEQEVKLGNETNGQNLFFTKKQFDPTLAAEQSATAFLKAVRMKKQTLYNSYDLLRFSKVLEKVRKRLSSFHSD